MAQCSANFVSEDGCASSVKGLANDECGKDGQVKLSGIGMTACNLWLQYSCFDEPEELQDPA